ncbi:Hypothetical_protein [Hexamita inflata]|uniref:Hypothetical_protein n=1 Tax=Hexamita inflata TaxID=28002 RepID=A0ABP1GEY9_9EUKA
MSQQKVRRNTLSQAEKTRVHDQIVHYVCSSLKLDKFEVQEAQDYQRNRDSMRRTINWKDVDMQIGRRYATKSYSYKTFFDVIIQNLLPSYPHEIVILIYDYIQEQVQLQLGLQEIARSPRSLGNLVKKISKQTKDEFNLQGSDIYSYKKEVDRINNAIGNIITDCCNMAKNVGAGDLIVFQQLEEPKVQLNTPGTIVNGLQNRMDSTHDNKVTGKVNVKLSRKRVRWFILYLRYFGTQSIIIARIQYNLLSTTVYTPSTSKWNLQIVNVNINLIIIVKVRQSKCVYYHTLLVRRRQRVVWRQKYLSILFSKLSLFLTVVEIFEHQDVQDRITGFLKQLFSDRISFLRLTEMINTTGFLHAVFYFSEINLQAKLLN